MRVAVIHYWLVNMRGGEKVVEAICDIFPDADIYTHAYSPEVLNENFNKHKVRTTFIQKLPGASKYFRHYLPLMPLALEQLDLRDYDLVISSESGPAKGVITGSRTLHICYCHTPMRYIWDMYHDYLKSSGSVIRILFPLIAHYLRMWDYMSASRVDHFIANSEYVAGRIKNTYGRAADVINPPVDVSKFQISHEIGDFYLIVGQLVSYKNTELAVRAFNASGKNLIIIGEGEDLNRLKKMARKNIKFLGWQPFEVIKDHYARCSALIFPGIEDFGIVPVEAMASGRPVIAYRDGGILETVIEGKTGLFFKKQDPDSLNEAVNLFEKDKHVFDTGIIAQHAKKFDKSVFVNKLSAVVEQYIKNR